MKTSLKALSPHGTGIAVLVLAAALYLPLSYNDISMLDEGALLYVAERLTKGDVLYRDIVTGIMPGVYYLQALFFSLLGYSVTTGRVLAGATLVLNSLLLYSISGHFLKKHTSFIITLLFISMAIPAYRWPGYSQTSITFVLIGLLFFLSYLGSSSYVALIISGAAAGLALLFKQNYGVFITAGLGLILLSRLAAKKEWKPVFIFSLSFIVPVLLTILYFYSQGALPPMVQYTFISLFEKAANVYYKPYPLLSRGNPLFFYNELYNFIPFRDLAIWTLRQGLAREAWIKAVVAVIYLLPPLIIAASVLYTAAGIIRKKMQWKETTLVLVSFFLFLGVFPRSDIHHLTFILPPIMITGALLGRRLPLTGRALAISRGAAFTLICLFSLICLASSYMPLVYPPPGQKKEALHIARAYGIRAGSNGAAVIRAVTRDIKGNTSPEEAILVVPTGAMYYFLTGRKSAVPYPLIMPGAMDEAVVIKAMERPGLKYVIYSDMSFDGKTLSRHMPLIHGYIIKNYHIASSYPVKEVGGGTYVLKRGAVKEEIIPIGHEAKEALDNGASGAMPLYYDFVKKLTEAKSGVILGSGRGVPLFRANQVARNAWLLKDAILQKPGRGWSKVYTSFTVHVPADSALRFSIGQSPVVWHRELGDGALFEVYVYDIKEKRLDKLFSRYIDPKSNMSDRRWFTYLAGLKKYWGRDLIISFVTSGGPRFNLTGGKINRWKHVDLAGWGNAGLIFLKGRASGAEDREMKKIAGHTLSREAFAKMARFDDISFFLEEEKKDPGDYDVHLALGTIYERTGKADKAAREFRAALKAYPAGSEAKSRLARYYLKAGRIKEAEVMLAKGLKQAPGDAGLNMAMANLYMRRKEYDRAIAAYGRVLRSRPTSEWARLGLARGYLSTGKAARAMAEANKVLETHPGSSAALIMLGDSYRFKKEWKRAEKRYGEALKKAPGSFAAAYKMGLTLRAQGRTDEALRAYRRAMAGSGVSDAAKRLAKKEIADITDTGKGEKE